MYKNYGVIRSLHESGSFHSPELTGNAISYNNLAFASCTDAKFCVSTVNSDSNRLTPVKSRRNQPEGRHEGRKRKHNFSHTPPSYFHPKPASRLQPDYVLMPDRLLSVELKAERATPIRG